MSGFTASQVKALLDPLERDRVHSREVEGRRFDYIEGWFAIAEANAIFGYAGWDREMAQFERVFERVQGKVTDCGYLARVRIRVRAGETVVVREGTGFGHAIAAPDEAHEKALKAAETDATKRALATFGNRFGLGLYDKEQQGVGGRPTTATTTAPPLKQEAAEASVRFVLKTDDGTVLAEDLSPEAYCSGLRQMIEAARCAQELAGLRVHNAPTIALLRESLPELKTTRGTHYADLLDALMSRRERSFVQEQAGFEAPADTPTVEANNASVALQPVSEPGSMDPSTIGRRERSLAQEHTTLDTPTDTPTLEAKNASIALQPVSETVAMDPTASESRATPERLNIPHIATRPAIDKSLLALGSPRRIRNKTHLRNVAAKPCLICEEGPCHAHHVTFAQPRGLSVKVSDEYTVPLCAAHHNEVHRLRPEEAWWRRYGIDPLREALVLWQETLSGARSPGTSASRGGGGDGPSDRRIKD